MVAAVTVAAFAGVSGAAGTAQAAPAPSSARPCDIYAGGHTPCVAAYSTVRALSAATRCTE
ncbi:MAG TPA: arabinofuranosidase catalytic domain-containing protein [Streptosporangiaceae bacterium]|nr:arabinofuranosidase catalytic domain-containing protein [Streptosporangiaceae bacterium]